MSTGLEIIVRLLLAATLGAIIGYQRERHGKAAGLRTNLLISVGSALFTLTSIYGFGITSDPSRVAAGIVTGVGFLGAGAIIRRAGGQEVGGLTTAATIWAVAAIGLTAGAGLYLLSVVAAALILVVLLLPHPIR